MNKSFSLITGASSGIGLEIAKELASRGKNVLLTARREKRLIKLQNEIISKFNVECDFICADLSQDKSVTKIYNFCKKKGYFINILINNAGYALPNFFHNTPMEE